MPEPELLVKQLHGITVCDTDDVVKKNWHGKTSGINILIAVRY